MLLPCGLARGEAVVPAERVQKIIDGIIACQLQNAGADDVQAWIDDSLSQTAGKGTEWLVFGLSRQGRYDFSAYHAALLDNAQNGGVLSAATRQKYALVLLATGGSNDFVEQTAQETIGAQGIMTWVYGLHLLNNGCKGSVTVGQVVEELLRLQLADGGWALRGDAADVDVTAMTIQALAPHANDERVAEATERAVEVLSKRQLETGDFNSYGAPNPESAAQVMIALAALDADVLEDERFTTMQARETQIMGGVKRGDRKKSIDSIAASYILEGYLLRMQKRAREEAERKRLEEENCENSDGEQ